MSNRRPTQKGNRALDTELVRSQFPGAEDKTYLDAACVSIAPQRAREAVADFADRALLCPAGSATEHHLAMDELRQQAIPQVAELLSANPTDVALVESTTHGLNIAARGLGLPSEAEILVCDMEFLQSPIPWIMEGYRVVSVPSPGGRVLPEHFEALLTSNTKAIVLSSTQWNNGFRADLKEFSDLCHRHGLLLVVDAVQELGAMKVDVNEVGVDVLTAGGHKWLNSPFGCGLLYVSPDVRERMVSPSWGYLNLNDPEGGWGNYFSTPEIRAVRGADEYSFMTSAKRLETGGTSNYPGAIGLAESIRLVNELGTAAIERHILGLTDVLIDGLHGLGVQVVTVSEKKHRSGIVSFRFYEDINAERDLVARLHQQRIFVSIRFTGNVGGIRVSSHYFNTNDDLQKLLDALKEEIKTGSQNARVSAQTA